MINNGRRYRSLTVKTQPVVEPVSVSEAKAHCRIDTTADDAYVAALVSAAREYVETYLDETLIDTEYVMRLDAFPAEIELPRPPMSPTPERTAVSITYTTTAGTAVLEPGGYRVAREAIPGVVRTPYGGSWPSYLLDRNAVTVTWWAGRGPDGGSVSRRVKAAILLLVGHWYERRLAVDATASSETPFGVRALLDSAKWGSYA
jgi:uncharacterized phiE125 gp8 family phage protein